MAKINYNYEKRARELEKDKKKEEKRKKKDVLCSEIERIVNKNNAKIMKSRS